LLPRKSEKVDLLTIQVEVLAVVTEVNMPADTDSFIAAAVIEFWQELDQLAAASLLCF